METEAKILTVAGRRFKPPGVLTLRRDIFIMSRVRRAKLDSLPMNEGESAEAYAHRLLDYLMGYDEVMDLLGAMLVPENVDEKDWTPKLAAQIAETLGSLVDDEGKAAVRMVLISVLVPFLSSGLASLTITASSSGPVNAAPPPSANGNGEEPSTIPSDSGNGDTSSDA